MMGEKFELRRTVTWGGAICALLIATLLQAGTDGARSDVQVNAPQAPLPTLPSGRPGRTAQAIAADRTGKLLVASWETLQGTCGDPFGGKCLAPKPPGISAVGYSTDGGRTWTDAGPPFLGGNVMTSGHPWLDTGGADGQSFFLVSRARTVTATEEDNTPGGSGQVGIAFYRGRFHGGKLVWNDDYLFSPMKADDLYRAPSIAAAKDGSGTLYLSLTRLLGMCTLPAFSCGQIEFFRSADEGKTWEGPVIISRDDSLVTPDPKDPKCGTRGTYQLSSSPAIGAHGEVYVIWQFGPGIINPFQPVETTHTVGIRFTRSLDGGRTWSPARDLAIANSMSQNAPVGYSKPGLKDYPRIAVAPGGPHRGRVYVTYASALTEVSTPITEQSLTSSQIYLMYSDDAGATWSKPAPIGPAVPPTGIKRFWPAVAVRAGGDVDVVYMESQEKQITADPNDIECNVKLTISNPRKGKVSSLVDTYAVRSTDGGATFGAPVRLSSSTSNWCKSAYPIVGTQYANFGDFIGITTGGNRTFAAWPDGRNNVADAYAAEVPAVEGAKQNVAGKK